MWSKCCLLTSCMHDDHSAMHARDVERTIIVHAIGMTAEPGVLTLDMCHFPFSKTRHQFSLS